MVRVLVILSLLSALAYGGVHFLYSDLEKRLQHDMAAGRKSSSSEQVASLEQKEQGREKAPDFQVIIKRNIFQAQLDITKNQAEETTKEENLAETRLQLALVGTVSGNERDARAIIVDEKKKRQDLYQIGDAVQGALIKKIERGRVVLEVNGRDEVLLIKERKGGAAPPSRESSSRGLSRELPTVRNAPARSRETIPVARPHRRIVFRQDREQAKDVFEPERSLPDVEPPIPQTSATGTPSDEQIELDGEQAIQDETVQ